MTERSRVQIAFTHDFQEACDLRDQGYEPIECAFGQYGSVMGQYNMDHHGAESHREGVALRACRDHFGARSHDPRFVVTGTPDADAVLAIIALAGLVDASLIQPDFYRLVDQYDVDPIGIDLLSSPLGQQLAWFNQLTDLRQSQAGFERGVDGMVSLLTGGLDQKRVQQVVKSERNRLRTAAKGIIKSLARDGMELPVSLVDETSQVRRGEFARFGASRVVVVHSNVWGFDVWYRAAPIVVSYAERIQKITVGCPDRETAELLFGPGGLKKVWAHMGRGWGGRESIGGSPRGVVCALSDAFATAEALLPLLDE
ncbi:MAG: hypothetical protein ACON3Z_14395 [Bradymonadia bacterium]